jgi:hypothetical protein
VVDFCTIFLFCLDITLPASETDAMLLSCSYYRRAVQATHDKRSELLRRLASVNNELAVRYMNDAQRKLYKLFLSNAIHLLVLLNKCLMWCPGQNKRIAPLSFHGCRKRRLKG